MNRQKLFVLAGAAALALIAGSWLSTHRASQQRDLGGGKLFADLQASLGEVEEIRIAKGDGSRVTLRRGSHGWSVVEREYAADSGRVRELLLGLVDMKVVERKTSDPANYARIGVEAPESPTAAGTLVAVVAGPKTWSIIVGRSAAGRAVYVRKPAEAASALVTPAVVVDPDPKRWIDRLIADIPGANVHEVGVTAESGPSYLLTRAGRGDADIALSPIPKGRTAAAMSINAQLEALTAFNFDDVRARPATAAAPAARAIYRTFDGQVIEFAGHREAEKSFVTVTARRDSALAARFAAPAAADATPNQTVERLAGRTLGVEYEIPGYKYETLFKAQEGLLEPKPDGKK